MLARPSARYARRLPDGVPGQEPEIGVLGGVILTFQIMRIDVVSGKQATG